MAGRLIETRSPLAKIWSETKAELKSVNKEYSSNQLLINGASTTVASGLGSGVKPLSSTE